MSRRILGSVAGALALTALAAPSSHAAGRPATVTVRVEGPHGRLVLEQVRTSPRPVVKDGEHACSGTSAAGALELATGGDWTASYGSFGYFLTGVAGIESPSASTYWTVWRNGRSSMTGLCDTELENGDELLLFLCRSGPDFSCVNRPLGLSPLRARGGTVTVAVVTHADDGRTSPAPGATVSGGVRPVRADARGRATVRLRDGQSALLATRAGDVPSAPVHCADGRCGHADRTPPTVRVRGIRDGAAFPAARAPRVLRGVAADPAGVRVELRLTRRADGACSAFDARRDAFAPCARVRSRWFAAGDRRRWSYLLPARLAPGRYVLAVRATDPYGNARTVAAAFRVQPARTGVVARAAARAPRVTVRIVGVRRTLVRGRTVRARAATVRADGRRCAVAAGTPLAALLAVRRAGGPPIRVADYGACSRRAADGGGLYVRQIGGASSGAQAGWVYAVGRRVGTAGAADPYGPFGDGPLRDGQRVTWFWCERAGACERVP